MPCHYSIVALPIWGSTHLIWLSAQHRLPKQEMHRGVIQQFCISPLTYSHSLPHACLWMCAGMEGRHVLMSHNMVMVSLRSASVPSVAVHGSVGQQILVETERTFPSLTPHAWLLVWSTRAMNSSEQKNMLMGNIILFGKVHCPHPC